MTHLRSRALLAALTAAAASVAGSALASTQLADGGFETQGSGVSNYCYFNLTTAGGGPCAAGAWVGSGLTGLQNETNTAWPGIATPDGEHYAFVQQDTGVLSQTFTANDSGAYTLTWLESGRPQIDNVSGGTEHYIVDLFGDSVLQIGDFTSSSGEAFTTRTSDTFSLVAGHTYTLSFYGTVPYPEQGDQTAYIDAVALNAQSNAVPEPTEWVLMICGLGLAGAALRRGRIGTAAARMG